MVGVQEDRHEAVEVGAMVPPIGAREAAEVSADAAGDAEGFPAQGVDDGRRGLGGEIELPVAEAAGTEGAVEADDLKGRGILPADRGLLAAAEGGGALGARNSGGSGGMGLKGSLCRKGGGGASEAWAAMVVALSGVAVDGLDQGGGVFWEVQSGAALQQEPRAQQEVRVVYVLSGAEDWLAGSVAGGRQEREFGSGKGSGAWVWVAVQAAGALDEQVDGSELTHHEVEVEVEALLDDLSGNEDGAVGTEGPVFAEAGDDAVLAAATLGGGIARVVEFYGNTILLKQAAQVHI